MNMRSAVLCFVSIMTLIRNVNVISDWFAGLPHSTRTKEHALRSTPGITSFSETQDANGACCSSYSRKPP
jgi:hypothetical protein